MFDCLKGAVNHAENVSPEGRVGKPGSYLRELNCAVFSFYILQQNRSERIDKFKIQLFHFFTESF